MDLGFGKDMYSFDKNWRVTEKDIIFKDVEMNITLRKYKAWEEVPKLQNFTIRHWDKEQRREKSLPVEKEHSRVWFHEGQEL